MAQRPDTGSGQIIAAAILGAALVVTGWIVKAAIDNTTEQLSGIKQALADTQGALEKVASARPAGGAPAGGGPDPSKKYTVKTEGTPFKGNLKSAKIEIIEFSDFQCPFCGRVVPTLKQIQDTYGDKVKIGFKHLPLSIHPKAPEAHAAAEAAHRQGKFWEMHDWIFEKQSEIMGPQATKPPKERYLEFAKEKGLDVEKFEKDMASEEVKKKVNDDAAEAAKLGITGTPGFFINGRFLRGAQPFEGFKTLIDEELTKAGG
jgi:protein-disulfide isomerase